MTSSLVENIMVGEFVRLKSDSKKTYTRGKFNQAIEIIKQYENDNFGTVNTDFSEAEKVCNMYVYILGEEIINNLETVKNNWDDDFTPELLEELKTELEAI